MNEGDISEAYDALVISSRQTLNQQHAGQLRSLATQLEQEAESQLAEADRQYKAGNHTAAIATYVTISKMTKLKAGATARRRLADVRQDPAYKNAMREVAAKELMRKVKEYQTSLLNAKTDAQRKGIQRRIDTTLHIITQRFGDTETGKLAAGMLNGHNGGSGIDT